MNQKKVFDSIHRFIHLDALENALITTMPYQRLHYIHQLGTAYLVYPGGTHKRFEHCLGVMELATRIYDQITIVDRKYRMLPEPGSEDHLYWRKIIRMAALCHDLGHLPFSHTAERELLGEKGHEMWTAKIIESDHLMPIWDKIPSNRDVVSDIKMICIGEAPNVPYGEVLREIVSGDFFGADRIDYLIRDAQYTGLAYGAFDYHQLLEMLRVLPYEGGMRLGVDESGLEASEALLVSRYFLHKRLCQYSSVKSYGFHMTRFMKNHFADEIHDIDRFLSMTDDVVIAEMQKAVRDPDHTGYEDAAALTMQKERYKAIPIPSKEILELFTQIPQEKMGSEIDPTPELLLDLNFPVNRRDGSIVCGNVLSQISIPQKPTHWLFVAPEHKEQAFQLLSPSSDQPASN